MNMSPNRSTVFSHTDPWMIERLIDHWVWAFLHRLWMKTMAA